MPGSTCLHIQDRESGPIRVVELPWISVRIGRAAYCEICLPDERIAEEVCRLTRKGRTWSLVPANGGGPVVLEGRPLDGPCPLPFDVPFGLGPYWLTLRHDVAAEPEWEIYSASSPPEFLALPPATGPEAPPVVEPDPIPSPTPAATASRPSEGIPHRDADTERWRARWKAAEAHLKARSTRLDPGAGRPAYSPRPARAPEADRITPGPMPTPTPPVERSPRPAPPPSVALNEPAWDTAPPEPTASPPRHVPIVRPSPAPPTGHFEAKPSVWSPPPKYPPAAPDSPRPGADPRNCPPDSSETVDEMFGRSAEAITEETDHASGPQSGAAIVALAQGTLAEESAFEAGHVAAGPIEGDRDSGPPMLGPASVDPDSLYQVPAVAAGPEGTLPDGSVAAIELPSAASTEIGPLGTSLDPSAPSQPARGGPGGDRASGPPRQRKSSRDRGGGGRRKGPPRRSRGDSGRADAVEVPGERPAATAPKIELPSVREILANHRGVSGPRPSVERPRKGRRPIPTVPREPGQWVLPGWLALPPVAACTIGVGLAACVLSWWWARDASNSSVIAHRLLAGEGGSGRRRPLPEGLAPPGGRWLETTARHLAQWGVYLGGQTGGERGSEEEASLLTRALEISPLEPTARLALSQLEAPGRDGAGRIRGLGLSRDSVSLAWGARRLMEARKKDAALRVYGRALSAAAEGGLSRSAAPRFSDDPASPRYLLPAEDAVRDIVAELAGRPGLEFAEWSRVLPRNPVVLLATARLLREQGRAEADALLDELLDDARPVAPDPGDPRLLAARAEALALRSRWAEAAGRYQQAIDRVDNDLVRRSWWFNLAAVAQDESQRQAAIRAALAASGSDDVTRRAGQVQRSGDPRAKRYGFSSARAN